MAKAPRKKTQGRKWLVRLAAAGGIFAVLCAVFLAIGRLNQETQAHLDQARYDLVSGLLSQQLRQLVESHIDVVDVMQQRYGEASGPLSDAEFVTIATRIARIYKSFTAINRIDPNGVIAVVTPPGENQAALGKNLLSRDDVRPFLLAARDTRQMQLTDAVPLYQGGLGFVFYMPLYDTSNEFVGWLNGVFRIGPLMEDFVKSNGFDRGYVQARFVNQAEPFYKSGTLANAGRFDAVRRFKILNQELEVALDLEDGKPRSGLSLQVSNVLLSLAGMLSSFFIAYLFYRLMQSRDELTQRLSKERFDNVMMNILTHDLANNSFAIKAAGYMAMRKLPEEQRPLVNKILMMTEAQTELLSRVRDMRAIEMGKKKLMIEPVRFLDLCESAQKMFEDQLRTKGIEVVCEAGKDAEVIAVDRLIFQNNVINNLVSNAIKFSDHGGRITMRSFRMPHALVVAVEDHGIGMTPEAVGALFLENLGTTTEGTSGELGTGLGMLQVKAYMDFVGGDLEVVSRAQEQNPEDHGTLMKLILPATGTAY